ncbi:putative adenosine deaminase [Exophiala viscosa]|uniref:Adenosine deaminase n=1 Tax=Exophiala viscosa TaxID=2486360 RepID=A0AAN6DP37_9EURO|nr:putative adenosine deaminase [Exophiala viscosa]KAI1620929.1 putative adenosine deaminase [Exophiala viscosa]
MGIEEALGVGLREKLKDDLLAADDKFALHVPKVELHVHIEGTITAELRWKFTQRNGTKLRIAKNGPELKSLAEVQAAMDLLRPDPSRMENNKEETFQFFEAYFEGFECLKTKEDYFDLAMHYFEHAATMNVRYVEIFWDPQGHTTRGISWNVMMDGFREASKQAEEELNVKSAWIMCFLRDLSTESAMEHYKAALPYRDIIVGIGLDSNEMDRPPTLFEEVFSLARRDGFKLTMHCDVGSQNTHEHIRQAACVVAGKGLDRIDHGLNAAEKQDLIDLILKQDVGMTICPWSYLRHETYVELGPKIRQLYDAGIKISINSDDPAYMEDCWILHNFLLVKHLCGFDDKDVIVLAKNAVNISWAKSVVKQDILEEIDVVYERFYPTQ